MAGQLLGLNIVDESNLYLVQSGLKPAAMIDIDPRNQSGFEIIKHSKNGVENWLIELKPEVIEGFRDLLTKSGISYKDWSDENTSETYDSKGKLVQKQKTIIHQAKIGKDKGSLEALLDAKTDLEIGWALGYPVEAVRAFGTTIDGEMRDGQYQQVCLAKAKQAGIDLPLWLAYVNFVPEQLDILNRNVSATSQVLGERYQRFVRENNPDLAARIEKDFLNRRLPDSWEKTPKNSYRVCFKYNK